MRCLRRLVNRFSRWVAEKTEEWPPRKASGKIVTNGFGEQIGREFDPRD